jgi:glyoxylase-like metal-dependent hydrolase (beta-lactamase superfamily II)
MELTEFAPGVFELRLAIPWEDERVNCFLLPDGDRVDMIDCGMSGERTYADIRAAVREVAGPGARLGTLLVTHIHPDHYGAAGELTATDGAQLLLHRLEVPMVHPRYLEIDQLVEEVGRYLRMHGVPEPEAGELKNSSRRFREFVKPAAPTLQLEGTETIELGCRRLRVEWTPGHSPGHVCLFDPTDRLLFAGDQLLPDYSPNIGLHPQSTHNPLDDYLAGLRRIVQLDPRTVLPAHGRPFQGPAQRVEALQDHHRRRKDQILEIVGDQELTAWEVAVAVWGRRSELHDSRLALQEGLAHLQSLSRDGLLEKRAQSGGRFSTPKHVPAISWRRPR